MAALGLPAGRVRLASPTQRNRRGKTGRGDNYHSSSSPRSLQAESYAPCHCVNAPASRETHNAPLSPVY